jgi:hypothetical protein
MDKNHVSQGVISGDDDLVAKWVERYPNRILLMSNGTPRAPWQTQALPMPRREESADSILMCGFGTTVFSHFCPEAFGRHRVRGSS